jgi:uncharacterized protein YaeQ
MALPSTRIEFKISLSHPDRGALVSRSLIVARHPSETLEHVAHRVLAWCAFYEEDLALGPGLCDGDAPDLVAKDARGDTRTWIACGRVPWEKVRRTLGQFSSARVIAFFCDERLLTSLEREIADLPRVPKELGRVEAWIVEPLLVKALAKDARRQSWTVTVVDGHLYVDADGASHEGSLSQRVLAT